MPPNNHTSIQYATNQLAAMNLQSQYDNSHFASANTSTKPFASNGVNQIPNYHRHHRQTRPPNSYHTAKPIPPIENDLKSTTDQIPLSGSGVEKDWSIFTYSVLSSQGFTMCESQWRACNDIYLFLCPSDSLTNHTNAKVKDKSCNLNAICSSTFYINMKALKRKDLVKQRTACFSFINTFISIARRGYERERDERKALISCLLSGNLFFAWLVSIPNTILT